MEEKEIKQENIDNNQQKEQKNSTKKKSRFPIILLEILGIIIVIIVSIIFIKKGIKNNSNSTNTTTDLGLATKNYTVKESETKSINLVDYDSENFSMKIPEGWKVETCGKDMYFTIRVFDPNDDRYQIFAILKAEPLLKNYKAKTWYENYYKSFGGDGNKLLAKAIVLPNPTIEDFYCSFNDYINFTKDMGTTFNAPDLKNFAVVESFKNNSQLNSIAKDDKIVRGTFQDSKTGKNGEGLFMGTLVDQGSNMTLGYDCLFYTIYNVFGISAGEFDLINYQDILTKSLNSLVYKDSFTNTAIQNMKKTTNEALSLNKSINDAFASYNSAWSSRQKSYDISSQKYSDATLGYERVYDTDTGEVYKAYNGFTDDYNGQRYQPITDNMYTESVTGYIEKAN